MSHINIIKSKGSCYLKFQPAGRFSPGPVVVGASQTLSTVRSVACGPMVDEIQQVLHAQRRTRSYETLILRKH